MDTKPAQTDKALPVLFLTEMWERFGFYVVQGLLVLYMTSHFGYSDSESFTILGVFTALVYVSPLPGGFIASRLLGYRTCIVWGGLFLILGYALLALPFAELLLHPALATIIIGNGLFKPNISSLLGTQFEAHDPRRDSAYTLFYIGINLGALLAGMSSGYVKDYYGWQVSFSLASVGLIIGLLTFAFGRRYLKDVSLPGVVSRKLQWQLFLYCLLALIGVCFLLHITALANWLLPCIGSGLVIFLIVLTAQQTHTHRNNMFVLSTLIMSSVVFWMLMLQMFYSANLFIERLVDKQLFGFPLSSTVFWGSESIFIILLGPVFALSWQSLGEHHKNPSPISKFIIGIVMTGFGFLVLALSTFFPNSHGLVHPLWIFLAYSLITIGELFISPIGLSAISMLAPPSLIGLLMGTWFVATGFGGIFAGLIARLASLPDSVTTVSGKLAIYQSAFIYYSYIAFFVAIFLFFTQFVVKKFRPL